MNSSEDTNEVSKAQSTGITYKIYENWATLYANKTSSVMYAPYILVIKQEAPNDFKTRKKRCEKTCENKTFLMYSESKHE